jgi:putative SOS response-associated peptidase YedK
LRAGNAVEQLPKPGLIDFRPTDPNLVQKPELGLGWTTDDATQNARSLSALWRWFTRADKLLFFFFAGIWRPWTGDRGTKKTPNVGDHTLFSIMTTEPNAVVEPVHEQAMPVILMTAADNVDRWLNGNSVEHALAMQKPAANDAFVVGPPVKPEKKAA